MFNFSPIPSVKNRLPITPLSSRMPSIVEEEVVKNMTILDRSTLRASSRIGRELADKYPYLIDTIFIYCDSKQLNITVREANGPIIILSPENQLTGILTILNNPNLLIRKLCFFTRRGITGDQIHKFAEKLKEGGIQRGSLNVQQFKVGYDIFIKDPLPTRRGRTEVGIKEMMELCIPRVLARITLDVDYIDIQWTDIVETSQWKQAVNVRIIGK